MSKHIDIKAVARAALDHAEAIARRWAPNGKRVGPEWQAINPTRADSKSGSFSLNFGSGKWADFASGDKGGDMVSYVAYVERIKQPAAARLIADFIGFDPSTPTPAPTPKKSEATERPILPIPAQAKPPPGTHPVHGTPSFVWCYKNQNGEALFYVYRFDSPGNRKQILPLSLCSNGWRWAAVPAPRPLYALDKLAAKPNAPVIFVEGEKAADAAARLMPDHVATTTPNGAQSPGKADFLPLKKRLIYIWPDADAPGTKYADDVAALARQAGAEEIYLLDITSLSIDPTTAEKVDLAKGWDAANALAAGWHADTIKRHASFTKVENNTPKKTENATDQYPRYECRADGVYYVGLEYNRQKKHYAPAAPVWICSPLTVAATTRDAHGESWGRLLVTIDPDHDEHRWVMPMAMLAGGGDDLRAKLLDLGVIFSPANETKKRITEYIATAKPNQTVRCTHRIGLVRNDFSIFVLPHRTIGGGDETYIFTGGIDTNPYRTAGTLADWRDNIAALCVGNSRLLFVVSLALAGPLMKMAGDDGGGFNLFGSSSTGKTTALRAAASVWGGVDYIQRWRATDNGMESLGPLYTDTFLALDEMAQIDPRTAGEAAYLLANGAGKNRADRNGDARRKKTWRVNFLSTAEITLAEHVASSGRRAMAGQEIRMIDIPADAGKGLGIFDTLKE